MYCMQDASSMRGGNAVGTAHHFPGGRFKFKKAHKSLQVGDMADKDIKTFLQKVGKGCDLWGGYFF